MWRGNAILINGFFGFPQMGVAGAAVSHRDLPNGGPDLLACITWKRKCTVRFSLQYLHLPAKTFRALLVIALPSGTEALS